jgi:hypothetical protein
MRSKLGLWRRVAVASVLALAVAADGGAAFAQSPGEPGKGEPPPVQQQQSGAVSPQVLTTASALTITHVSVARQDTTFQTSSTTFVPVTGAALTVSVPDGETALLIARFTAESQCEKDASAEWCSVRIVAGTNEMFPQSGFDFAFDSETTPVSMSDNWEAHAMERSIVVGPGTYQVVVQAAMAQAGGFFALDDWHLIVEQAQRS